jgi:lipopolysaccharide/colanic/teichoic acid biosynthesis glycosyltransferase
LQLKPGITDRATLAFRHEEDLLAQAADVEAFYVTHCLPKKIEMNLQYGRQANLWSDVQVIVRTVLPWFD